MYRAKHYRYHISIRINLGGIMMKNVWLPLVLLGLFGVLAAGCSNEQPANTDHSSHVSQVTMEQEALSNEEAEPASWTLKAAVNEQNIIMVDTNLKLSDERYNGPHVEGEGHIHLYVNGTLVGPIVAPDTFSVSEITTLNDGENTIKLVLATNDHNESIYGNTSYEFKLMWDAPVS